MPSFTLFLTSALLMLDLGSARFSEYLKRVFNLRSGDFFNVAQVVAPVAPVWDATSAEHLRARGERLWAAAAVNTAGVGTVPICEVGLLQAAPPNTVSIVDYLVVDSTIATAITGGVSPNDVANAVSTNPRDCRDLNLAALKVGAAPTPLVTKQGQQSAAAPTGLVFYFGEDAAINEKFTVQLGVVLTPGFKLQVFGNTTGVSTLRCNFFGRERTFETSENQ